MNVKKRKIIVFLICIFWFGLIYYFSSKDSKQSTGQTRMILNIVNYLSVRYPKVNEFFEIATRNYSIVYVVRKMAHMFVFCVLQILMFAMCRVSGKSIIKSSIISMICVVIYACLDEYHQLYVPGRDGAIKDVFIDTIGALIGLSISLIFAFIKNTLFSKIRTQ